MENKIKQDLPKMRIEGETNNNKVNSN